MDQHDLNPAAESGVSTPPKMVVNLNQTVLVMLTADGVEIMRREHAAIFTRLGDRYPFKEPSTTEPTRFQLWQLMQTFGPHISLGRLAPFSTDIEIVPWALPPVDDGALASAHGVDATQRLNTTTPD
jgi:hypothetical protein